MVHDERPTNSATNSATNSQQLASDGGRRKREDWEGFGGTRDQFQEDEDNQHSRKVQPIWNRITR